MNVLESLQKIFRDIFDDETLLLTYETSPDDIEDWGSLTQISIILACEPVFDLKFDINEIVAMKNVGDMIDTIERKLKK
jgi:acyl carrier protein